MKKLKIISVFGTRPEAVKMAPLVIELGKNSGFFDSKVCVTAQHREMLDQMLNSFDITPDYDLNIMQPRQTLASVSQKILNEFDSVLESEKPDLVLVHGDTLTSTISALTAFFHKIPIGHVEAGLRSGNIYSPYPEEMNRLITGKLATLHFAPTKLNADNLIKENITDNIYITGNTAIDAMKYFIRENYIYKENILNDVKLTNKKIILMTAHRTENLGAPMENIFNAVKRIALHKSDMIFVYPVHKNPRVSDCAKKILSGVENIILTPPLEIADMHNMMNRCFFVMTDSGGLQEEAPSLGKPVLVFRTETERPEAVASGGIKIIGTDQENIYNEALALIDNNEIYRKMSKATNPYGDGHAAERIVEAIKKFFW